MADRVQLVEGSFFDAVADGGDAYVLKHVIHDWPDDDAVRILAQRAYRGRGRQARVARRIRHSAHDREFLGNWLDLEMLVAAGARERTAAEYGRLLSRAGFRLTRVVETASPYQRRRSDCHLISFRHYGNTPRTNPWSLLVRGSSWQCHASIWQCSGGTLKPCSTQPPSRGVIT